MGRGYSAKSIAANKCFQGFEDSIQISKRALLLHSV